MQFGSFCIFLVQTSRYVLHHFQPGAVIFTNLRHSRVINNLMKARRGHSGGGNDRPPLWWRRDNHLLLAGRRGRRGDQREPGGRGREGREGKEEASGCWRSLTYFPSADTLR